MNIEESVDRFIRFCTEDKETLASNKTLVAELDLVLVCTQIPEFAYDETAYPDPPTRDYQRLRAEISKNFPQLGHYCTAEGNPQQIDKASVLVGDAIEDLTDIVADLIEVHWCFKNTSFTNALWHFEFSF